MDNLETLKAQHDDLLAKKPDHEFHDESACVFCKEDKANKDSKGRGEGMDTFTKEQVAAIVADAVKEALAPVQAELDKYKEAASAGELETKLAEVRKEGEDKLSAVQDELDAAELRASKAEKDLEDSLTWISAVYEAEREAASIEIRKVERAELIKKETSFTEDFIAKRISDWAKLSDDDFADKLDEWKELSGSVDDKPAGSGAPVESAMRHVREDGEGKKDFKASLFGVTREAASLGLTLRNDS